MTPTRLGTLVLAVTTLSACRFGFEPMESDSVPFAAGGAQLGGSESDPIGAVGGSAPGVGGSNLGGASGGFGGEPLSAYPPTTVALSGTPSTSSQVGNESGGEPYSDPCPAGEVLIGLSGLLSSSSWLGQIRGHCATLTFSGVDPVTWEQGPTTDLPPRGEMGDPDSPWQSMCPDHHVIVSFSGNVGAYVDALVISCAPLVVSGTFEAPELSLGTPVELPRVGGDGGEPFTPVGCPEGSLSVGLELRTGHYVDLVQLVCRTTGG